MRTPHRRDQTTVADAAEAIGMTPAPSTLSGFVRCGMGWSYGGLKRPDVRGDAARVDAVDHRGGSRHDHGRRWNDRGSAKHRAVDVAAHDEMAPTQLIRVRRLVIQGHEGRFARTANPQLRHSARLPLIVSQAAFKTS